MTEKNKKKQILIVDDDVDLLMQLEIQLTAAGYDVVKAAGQTEAEELLLSTRPDAAVVDLMMENADGGFALCYHIKKKDPNIPVIIMTAVTSETGMEFGAGTEEEKNWIKADALLCKPVRFEQLEREIQRLTLGNE